MRRPLPRMVGAALVAVAAGSACSGATGGSAGQGPELPGSAASPAGARPAASPADVHFMSGMIPHHAQAVLMAGWVPSRGTRSDVRVLAARMLIGQRDEIEFMQQWLRDEGEPVPAADATHLRMAMNGVEHDMLMPGMLSAAELAQLESARGTEFERLFLTFMIRHHEGAIIMVNQLFASYGAAQDEDVFRFASDVYADQTSEIDRMQLILAELTAGTRNP